MSHDSPSRDINDPASFARPWRWLSMAVATLIAVLVVTNRIDAGAALTAATLALMAIELAPILAVLALSRTGARKGIVVAMLLGMAYVAHAAIIATNPDARWLGGAELLLALALFGALFMVGRALLAEERRLNP